MGNQKTEIEGETIQWQKWKWQKRQTMIYKTLQRKLKIEQDESTKHRNLTPVPRKGRQFLFF